MRPETQALYPPMTVTLRDGTVAAIRPLSTADADALVAFYAGIPRADQRHYYPHALDEEHALRNAARADSPHEVVLVLDVDDAIGGYAWYCWENDEAEQSTFGICIARPYQSSGAGRLLMTRLLEIAKTVGPPVMSLTAQHANARAVELYKKMGFQPIREQWLDRGPNSEFPSEMEYYMEQRVR
ncbi:MAG: GNAT family N-acetyltransferase [Armatimonadota bacterium]